MNLKEQLIYLRRSRDLTQAKVAKLAGLKVDEYRNMEAGKGLLNLKRLNKALDALDGSLCIFPQKFDKKKLPEKIDYVNNYRHHLSGYRMTDALKAMKKLFKELPNIMLKDNTAREAAKGLELFMQGILTINGLATYRQACQKKYTFYFEKENSGKLPIEKKTKSIEMLVLDIAYKCCHTKEFQQVPGLVEELLKED